MTKTIRRLHREEDGQVMLLALITGVFLVLIMAFPLNVGWTIHKRMKLQHAADAAAYSAAVVQADGLSAIAWLNNAMSWCYQRQYGVETKFCALGVYALLEKWGDTQGAPKPGSQDYDLDGRDWYKDFKDRVAGKTPIDQFNEFMGSEAHYVNKDPNSYNVNNRTLEQWTKSLRLMANAIATNLPKMMRYEAMRQAYVNTYDGTVGVRRDQDQVYMVFFPDEDSDFVQLNFKPEPDPNNYNGDVSISPSFMQYEKWHNKDEGGCRFVERAMQMAGDQAAFFLDSGTSDLHRPSIGDHNVIDSNGLLNMASIDDQDKPWFNEYDGQPRIIDDLYLAFAKTVICWHQKDKDGKGGHTSPDKTPCGHWHVNHFHLHYNCTHVTITIPFDGVYHFHIPIPTSHEDGFEKNRWCLDDYKCPMWSAPEPGCGCFGIGDIQSAINQGISAAQSAVSGWQSLVQQAEAAYNLVPDQAHLDALNSARASLRQAQENVQSMLNLAAVATNAMGLNPLMETHINESIIPDPAINPPQGVTLITTGAPGKGSDEKEWRHHAIHYCPLCFTNGASDFPDSEAASYHGLAYSKLNVYFPDEPELADHHFYLPDKSDSDVEPVKGKKKSMVRGYISDLLTSTYSNWFNFKKEADFHQIHKGNYSPDEHPGAIDAKLCPNVIFKPVTNPTDKWNFFNWGITVLLWQKHHSILFRKYPLSEGKGGIFMEMEGMLAMASAKVGIRVDHQLYPDKTGREGAAKYFPERLICGIGEKSRPGEPAGPYSASYMRSQFLENRSRSKPILNLFCTDWGARLIPIQKSVPEGEQKHAALYPFTKTKRIYFYNDSNHDVGKLVKRITEADWTDIDGQGWGDQDWEKLTQLLVH